MGLTTLNDYSLSCVRRRRRIMLRTGNRKITTTAMLKMKISGTVSEVEEGFEEAGRLVAYNVERVLCCRVGFVFVSVLV